jgi:hypothetical protein
LVVHDEDIERIQGRRDQGAYRQALTGLRIGELVKGWRGAGSANYCCSHWRASYRAGLPIWSQAGVRHGEQASLDSGDRARLRSGSTAAGRIVAATGAPTLKRMNLELGGKTPRSSSATPTSTPPFRCSRRGSRPSAGSSA